jgi:Xaa-Pro aminopeptidase
MRIPLADPSLFVRNRERLRAMLPPGALAIIHSNDVMPTNADGTLGYRQNSDLFFLSGIDQEESILLLYPDAPREEHRELLFLRETTPQIALWEGDKLDKERGARRSGIKEVRWTKDFDGLLRQLITSCATVWLSANEHARAAAVVETRNDRFIRGLRAAYPLHEFRRLAPLVTRLRMVKEPEEVAMIERACELTAAGFRRLLGFVRPGVREWACEAELLHEYTLGGSRGFAYPPIIGSGINACVLHYVENHATCEDGQMLLLDVAAEQGGWNADLTRTIPVNGRFTPRQRQVYQAVLRVLRHCETILRPGIRPSDYQQAVVDFMEGELIGLGLIDAAEAAKQGPDKPLVKKYFPHGTSHHLGIDVHDTGLDNHPVEVGNVFTIEPGIYIREENLGVRLENDYLIGATGNRNLLASAPIEAEEIEALMAP